MKCPECNGKGEEQYGDERLLCISCHGTGYVSQASIHNVITEFPERTDQWTWGDSR